MNSGAPVWSPLWRQQLLSELKASREEWDMLIVGGGITGAGIYREATRLGLKVLLLEQQDFAWGTSSRSSKMVHGGLRYLGTGQFSLANDSVKERQTLMNELPGLVNPLPFMMGHYKGMFPGPWLFDKVLTLYDWMAGHRYRQFFSEGIADFLVPGLNLAQLKGVTQFADAEVDDARLVLRVLHEGNNAGGSAVNYLRAVDTLRDSGRVSGLRVEDQLTQEQFNIAAKVVVNASGAWTDELRQTLGQHKVIRPLRGSHLVVPFWRLPVSYAVSFFHPDDKRPVFVFPWEGVSVIGTTDLDHSQNLAHEAAITESEIDYLLGAANLQFPEAHLDVSDVRASWSGVRPVVSKNQDKAVDSSVANKPSDEKREHAIWDDNGLVSVAGGKLTTFRLIALDVLKKAIPYLPQESTIKDLNQASHFEFSRLPENGACLTLAQKERLHGRYGRHATQLIAQAEADSPDRLGKIVTSDTLWAELVWCCQSESVQHLDDLLLRRTRIGLLLKQGGESIFENVRQICQRYLGWDDAKWSEELERYRQIIVQYYGLPDTLVAGGMARG